MLGVEERGARYDGIILCTLSFSESRRTLPDRKDGMKSITLSLPLFPLGIG